MTAPDITTCIYSPSRLKVLGRLPRSRQSDLLVSSLVERLTLIRRTWGRLSGGKKLGKLTKSGRPLWEEIDSWNWVGTKYGIKSAMSHKMESTSLSPADICYIEWNELTNRNPYPAQNMWRRQLWNLQFLHIESMSPKVNCTSELIFHKESITWNRCPGFLKV